MERKITEKSANSRMRWAGDRIVGGDDKGRSVRMEVKK